MAKFCTKCGKELIEGKKHVCKAESSKETVKEEKVKIESNIDLKESSLDCLNVIKNIFTKPFEAIKEFVSDNKLVAGIIMIVVTALATGLYKIATLKSMYGSSSGSGFSTNDLLNLFSGGSFSLYEKPNYLKEFFTEAGLNLLEYALIAFVGYLIISKLLKGKATWKQMVTAVAISLSIVLLGNLLNSILVFIDAEVIGYIRTYITTFAYIISILILYQSVSEVANIDKNKLFLSIASMSVCATCIIDIVNKIFD